MIITSFLNIFYLDRPSIIGLFLSFEIASGPTYLPSLQDYDIDENMPSNISSNYHTIQYLSTSDVFPSDLSFLRMNTGSLFCYLDEV